MEGSGQSGMALHHFGGTVIGTISISCHRCHHMNLLRKIELFSTSGDLHTDFRCEVCQFRLFVLGRSETIASIVSQESIPGSWNFYRRVRHRHSRPHAVLPSCRNQQYHGSGHQSSIEGVHGSAGNDHSSGASRHSITVERCVSPITLDRGTPSMRSGLPSQSNRDDTSPPAEHQSPRLLHSEVESNASASRRSIARNPASLPNRWRRRLDHVFGAGTNVLRQHRAPETQTRSQTTRQVPVLSHSSSPPRLAEPSFPSNLLADPGIEQFLTREGDNLAQSGTITGESEMLDARREHVRAKHAPQRREITRDLMEQLNCECNGQCHCRGGTLGEGLNVFNFQGARHGGRPEFSLRRPASESSDQGAARQREVDISYADAFGGGHSPITVPTTFTVSDTGSNAGTHRSSNVRPSSSQTNQTHDQSLSDSATAVASSRTGSFDSRGVPLNIVVVDEQNVQRLAVPRDARHSSGSSASRRNMTPHRDAPAPPSPRANIDGLVDGEYEQGGGE